MGNKSRLSYTLKNTWIGTVSQIVSLILSFILRTCFIHTLGNEYLSINGLFTNILTLLSFAELGIGASIVFSLYEPIANNDHVKISKLINLIGKAYNYVALTVAVIGLCIMPFLPCIITDIHDVPNINLLYLLFLANTSLSYVWGYKKSLLTADQKNYVVVTIHLIILSIQTIFQIAILFLTHNFILFLCVTIIATIANNILSTLYVNSHYAYIKRYENLQLEKAERKEIFTNIKAIVLYKIGSVLLGGTNNIVISAFLKTTLVGIASNYLLIVNAFTSLVNQSIAGLAASIGNYNVNATSENNLRVFKQLNIISAWFFGYISVGMAICLNPFITLWIGKNYLLDEGAMLSIVVGFYVLIINSIPSSYRTAMGLFKQTRWFPFCAAITNLLFSFIFAKLWGIAGVFWSTVISRFVFFNLIDAYYVIKHAMNANVMHYYRSLCLEFMLLAASYFATKLILNVLDVDRIPGLLVALLAITIVYNFLFLITHIKYKPAREALYRLSHRSN